MIGTHGHRWLWGAGRQSYQEHRRLKEYVGWMAMYWLAVQTVRRAQTALDVDVAAATWYSRAVQVVMAEHTRSEVRVGGIDSHSEAVQMV